MVTKGGGTYGMRLSEFERITVEIQPLDQLDSTISPLSVTGFSRTGNICDAYT